jgi:hypothetical protein
MDARLLFPNEYLAAADLQGKDVTLTISRLVQEALRTDKGDEDKWLIYFAEMEERSRRDKKKLNKRMVLNKTNAKTIAKLYGLETNDWIGKRITLFATTCQAFGETVDCIRIRESAPPSSRGQQRAPSRSASPPPPAAPAPAAEPDEPYDGPPEDLEDPFS